MDAPPDIAAVAGLIGDRARAAILMSLMADRALTATELARAAAVTKQTASAHLARLLEAQLVTVAQSGRHRYYRLADHQVASALERLVVLAEHVGARQVTVGPVDPALRRARVCYDHLAGELGVFVYDALRDRGFVRADGSRLTLTAGGERFVSGFGVDVTALRHRRRPLCLACLDWSVRRHHLAGALGAALLQRIFTLGWAHRRKGSRAVVFSALGERALRARLAAG
ncbi:MAG: helix-turn-helix transcriptional regulator [Gemmatimonadetes bacterium]|nr:helix-turn-helix transcriptional regulator [Gemmatimonadota bacterium]